MEVGNHQEIKQKKSVPCNQCTKTYSIESHLQRHVRASHENNTVHCNECEKEFKSKDNLLVHIRNVHKEKKTYKCDLCKKVYSYISHLNRHTKYKGLLVLNVKRHLLLRRVSKNMI